jgi:hypothetical protein
MACPRAWPRHRTPVLREGQAVKLSRPHARGSRALGNHPNGVIHDPACPRTPIELPHRPDSREAPVQRLRIVSKGTQSWNTPASRLRVRRTRRIPGGIGLRGHGANRDRTGDLLLANSSRPGRVPIDTGTSQRLRTLTSGCLRRFGNRTWNRAQPPLWRCGGELVDAPLRAPPGRRPRLGSTLARAVA